MDGANYSNIANASDYIYDYYANSPYFLDVSPGEPIVAALSLALIATPGLVIYIMTVIVILHNPQTFANKSYYILLLSLAICEIIQTFFCLIYGVPCFLLQKRIFGGDFDLYVSTIFSSLLYYVGLANMVLIAINRYVAVCRFSVYKRVFQPNRMRFYLLGAWIFGVFSGMWQFFPGFGYHILPHWYTWGLDTEAWGNAYFIKYDLVVSVILFSTSIFCYASIIIKRPAKINVLEANSIDNAAKRKRERAERKLALQFCLISSILLSCIVLNQIYISNRFYYLFLTLYYISFTCCNPIIYFVFNSDIRQNILKAIGRGETVGITVVSQTVRSENRWVS